MRVSLFYIKHNKTKNADKFEEHYLKKISNKKNYKIYDLRNLYSPVKMKKNKINYFSIGR